MKTNPKFPNWFSLVECWLSTHYAGRPCVVFSNPLEYWDIISTYFPVKQQADVMASDYTILPCRSVKKANTICNATPDSAPFCMVWDGQSIVNENT